MLAPLLAEVVGCLGVREPGGAFPLEVFRKDEQVLLFVRCQTDLWTCWVMGVGVEVEPAAPRQTISFKDSDSLLE